MRWVLAVLILLTWPAAGAQAQACFTKYCTQMSSCAEADYHFRQCGEGERDADNDGIPCENICGDSMDIYLQRRAAGDGQFGVSQQSQSFACEGKRRCSQMVSCAEARFYLSQCGVGSLDGNGDGVPCESICR